MAAGEVWTVALIWTAYTQVESARSGWVSATTHNVPATTRLSGFTSALSESGLLQNIGKSAILLSDLRRRACHCLADTTGGLATRGRKLLARRTHVRSRRRWKAGAWPASARTSSI